MVADINIMVKPNAFPSFQPFIWLYKFKFLLLVRKANVAIWVRMTLSAK